MIQKIFKIVWFVSLLTMTGVFIYCYASWPAEVSLSETVGEASINRNVLFYIFLVLAGIFNALVFVVTRMNFSYAFAIWFYGLVIAFHVFLVSVFIFITIFNSLETYDYAMVAPSLYGSILILMIWTLAWPVYLAYNKFLTQAKVG